MATDTGKVLSVNVGGVREFEYRGHPAESAIWKSPVSGRIAARGVNLEGDRQADRESHGGFDKAVYAYSIEDARWFEKETGRTLPYGAFGENLTTEGIDVDDAAIGERWAIGSAVFEVSEPRMPCWRLQVRMNDDQFVRRFTQALRPGAYLRIIVEGDVGAGDEIRVVEKPETELTVRDVFRIYVRDRHEADRLLAAVDPEDVERVQASLARSESEGQRRMLKLHGGSSSRLLVAPNLWAGVGLVRGGAGTALVGSHAEVAERLIEYSQLGIDHFILSGYPHLEEAYWFGEGVLPELRKRGAVAAPDDRARVPAGA